MWSIEGRPRFAEPTLGELYEIHCKHGEILIGRILSVYSSFARIRLMDGDIMYIRDYTCHLIPMGGTRE